VFTGADRYDTAPSALAKALHAAVPELQFTAGPADGAPEIAVAVARNDQAIELAQLCSDGRRASVLDNEDAAAGPTSLPGPRPPPGLSSDATVAGEPQTTCPASAFGKVPLVGPPQAEWPSPLS
jgi:hypothetical protein